MVILVIYLSISPSTLLLLTFPFCPSSKNPNHDRVQERNDWETNMKRKHVSVWQTVASASSASRMEGKELFDKGRSEVQLTLGTFDLTYLRLKVVSVDLCFPK